MAKYKIFNQDIVFPDSAERFFDMQYRAWNATASAACDFEKWYVSCGDILTVLKGYENKAAGLVIQYANQPLFDELTNLQIYDISEDSYDEQCLDFSEISEALDTIADKYNDIVAEQEAEEEYRAERKANRGRVVGGGFGVSGAIKGMAAAGAMNAISGMGHGIVNAIGNAGSALSASSSKRALYDNNATLNILKEGIKSDIISCFNAHMHLVNDRLDSYIVSAFDSDKAGAFFQNAKKVADKQQVLLLESFKNCPWDEELLAYIFTHYKSERKNIWDVGKRFYVDLSEYAEEAFASDYTDEAKMSEKEAQIVKRDILAQMKELGITSSSTITQIEIDGLNRLLESYDSALPLEKEKILKLVDTYDASQSNKAQVVHDRGVWELAKKYSVQYTQTEIDDILARYYTDVTKNSEEEAIKARKQIIYIMQILDASESATLDKLECDCLERICYNHQNADENTCNEMINNINCFEALEKNKEIFTGKINARITQIWSKEDDEVFDNLYLNTNIRDPEAVKKSIDFIKQKGRTSSSKKYISALTACTTKNIKKAKKFQKSTTKSLLYIGWGGFILAIILAIIGMGFAPILGGISVIPLVYYSDLKKTWNTLTLDGAIVHKMFSLTGKEERRRKDN